MTIEEYSQLSKPKMVVSLIEIMVQQGWDITNFIYGFRAYKKHELIKLYKDKLEYGKQSA